MAFEGLAEKLSNSFKKLRSKGKLTEADVKEAMREVRLALLEADVNYKVAKEFTKKVSDRAVGSEVMESLTPAQMVIKIVNEELTALMGGSEERLKMPAHPPAIIMMCGLQGAGKTTHAAKLAYHAQSPRDTVPCWWREISTAPRPSSSCRWWGRKPGLLCLSGAPRTRWSPPRRRCATPRITETTM